MINNNESKESQIRLNRALKLQSRYLLIANKGDFNLEGLMSTGRISFGLNGASHETYKNLLQKSKTKKYGAANLFVIEKENNGLAEGSFYKVSTNIYDSKNFLKERNSFFLGEKGKVMNRGLAYVTLNR